MISFLLIFLSILTPIAFIYNSMVTIYFIINDKLRQFINTQKLKYDFPKIIMYGILTIGENHVGFDRGTK